MNLPSAYQKLQEFLHAILIKRTLVMAAIAIEYREDPQNETYRASRKWR